MMAGLRKEGFTESSETWQEGQDHKAAVLKRGNELLEQNGEMERGTFSEAIGDGHRDGHRHSRQVGGAVVQRNTPTQPLGAEQQGARRSTSRRNLMPRLPARRPRPQTNLAL